MSEETRNTAPFLTDPVTFAQRKIRELWLWNHEKNAPLKAGNPLPTLAPADTISYCTLGNLAEQIERSMPGDVIRVLPEEEPSDPPPTLSQSIGSIAKSLGEYEAKHPGTFSMAAQGGDAPPECQKDEGGKEDGARIVTNPYCHTQYSRAIQVSVPEEVYREETHPSEFRLLHKRTGAYVLQGGFKSYRNGDLCAIKWRDFPTVEEEPEKPKNAWAQPQTKWGGRV